MSPLPDLRRRPALRRALLAGLVIGVGLCYLLPVLFFSQRGHQGPTLMSWDEAAYTARLTRVTQGHWTVGNPWTFERRAEPSLIPSLPELTLAPLARLGVSVDGIVVITRFVFSGLGALALALALRACGVGPWLALFAAAWVFTDAGLMHYKPLIHTFLGQEGLPYNRFSNPLFGLPLFFLAWGHGARAFLREENHRRHAVLAGLLLGLMFFISVYYWSHLVLTLVLTALFVPSAHRVRVLGWGAGITIVVSIPYWVMAAQLMGHPIYPHIAWRNGLLIADRGWYLLPHKTLWVFVAAGVLLARGARPHERALLAGAAAGLACYFSPLIVGRSFQNFHWTYTTAPFLYVAVFALAARWARERSPAQQRGVAAVAACGLLLSLGATVVSTWRQAETMGRTRRSGMGVVDQEYRAAWAWLRSHAPADSVVLAALTTQRVVPVRTGLRVFTDDGVELVSFEELLARNQILWTLSGTSPEAVAQQLTPTRPRTIASWSVGLPAESVAALVAEGRPAFDQELCARLAVVVADAQRRLQPSDVVALGRRFRLDYLVRGPNESAWGSEPERWLRLEPEARIGEVRIDRVLGWRDR